MAAVDPCRRSASMRIAIIFWWLILRQAQDDGECEKMPSPSLCANAIEPTYFYWLVQLYSCVVAIGILPFEFFQTLWFVSGQYSCLVDIGSHMALL